MKYVQLRELDGVTSGLNFNTLDTHVTGGCDLYTTKAASTDKKLYKDIENTLESQHKLLLRLSASLSPPAAELANLDLARSSPFGPLSQTSSRRTFAYLVATLNASHPDYDFSSILRPSDFKRERTLREVMTTVDDTLYNLRPRSPKALLAAPTHGKSAKHAENNPVAGATQSWGPKSWKSIDKEMSLIDCDVYSYAPDNDPFGDEDTALWSMHYFFFNRDRKRVCYFHMRAFSMLSHSPSARAKRGRPQSGRAIHDDGASKRAKFWFGKHAGSLVTGADEDDDTPMAGSSDVVVPQQPGDDEVDADETLEGSDVSLTGYSGASDDDYFDDGDDDDDNDAAVQAARRKGGVRRMSEHIAETMDL